MSEPVPADFLARAREALGDARYNLDGGRVRAAINRAYYACFYAAQAALVSAGERPRSHKGVHGRFAFHFVRTGRVPAEKGSILSFAARARGQADYDVLDLFDARAAADLVADAGRFVAAVEALVSSGRPEGSPDHDA